MILTDTSVRIPYIPCTFPIATLRSQLQMSRFQDFSGIVQAMESVSLLVNFDLIRTIYPQTNLYDICLETYQFSKATKTRNFQVY